MRQAFEMCKVGEFNCSQASLTSGEALNALRQLPKTNPSLYKQFTGECEDKANLEDETEPEFSADDDTNDDSDIPIDVIVSQIAEGEIGPGFEASADGRIERTGLAEDVDVEIPVAVTMDESLILGRGKREKRFSE